MFAALRARTAVTKHGSAALQGDPESAFGGVLITNVDN